MGFWGIIRVAGRLAQLVRALRLHRRGRGFESLSAHFLFVIGLAGANHLGPVLPTYIPRDRSFGIIKTNIDGFQRVFEGAICMDTMENICPEDWAEADKLEES
jgi:hypothetical protein